MLKNHYLRFYQTVHLHQQIQEQYRSLFCLPKPIYPQKKGHLNPAIYNK